MNADIALTSEITVRKIQEMGGDHMVVAAARVSTCGADAAKFADPESADESSGLINYLMAHRHGTPFEHSALTFFVHAPIFVWREWHRHRIGFSYNEESGRYKALGPVFWIPRRERPMSPVSGWKPGRPKFLTLDDARLAPGNPGESYDDPEHWYRNVILGLRHSYETAYRAYRSLIADGIALEVSRAVLPVGVYSSCWVTCNPRSLMSFLSLREHEPDAKFVSYPQAEIEEAARLCERVLSEGWPKTHAAFVRNGRVAP